MNDEDLRLRDQFAIAAMQGILTAKSYLSTTLQELSDNDSEIAAKIAITAYKMADAMRKVRLISFK